MCSIPSCDIINKTGGPLISNEIKSIYCTALMHVLLTAHPQARNKVRDQMFTSLKKKPKNPPEMSSYIQKYWRVIWQLFHFLLFSGFSLRVEQLRTRTHTIVACCQGQIRKKNQALREGRRWVRTGSVRTLEGSTPRRQPSSQPD